MPQRLHLPASESLTSVSLSPSAGHCLLHERWSERVDEDTSFQRCPRLRLMLIVIGVIHDQTPNMLALASPWETSRSHCRAACKHRAHRADIARLWTNLGIRKYFGSHLGEMCFKMFIKKKKEIAFTPPIASF